MAIQKKQANIGVNKKTLIPQWFASFNPQNRFKKIKNKNGKRISPHTHELPDMDVSLNNLVNFFLPESKERMLKINKGIIKNLICWTKKLIKFLNWSKN